jgi:hypothetical protein
LAKPKGPPRAGGKIDHPDLFEWAESVAARLAAFLGDVSAVSLAAAPGSFVLFLGAWLSSAEDYSLRPVLAVATIVTMVCTCIAWCAKSLRSNLSQTQAILLHATSIILVAAMMVLVVVAAGYQDFKRSSASAEAAVMAKDDVEAARAAAELVREQARAAREAANMALAAKDEAAKEAVRAVARLAEARCLQAREDAAEKANRAQSSAWKAAEDCRIQFNGQLIQFKSFQEQCGVALSRLNAARLQVKEAISRTCDSHNL